MKVVFLHFTPLPLTSFQLFVFFSRNGYSQVKSRFSCLFFLKNLRGIVRKAKVGKSANSVVTESSSRVTERAVRQRFYPNKVRASFYFVLLPLTTEAMGIWRFAGAFAVVERQGECGSKTAGMHVSQPMNIGVC